MKEEFKKVFYIMKEEFEKPHSRWMKFWLSLWALNYHQYADEIVENIAL